MRGGKRTDSELEVCQRRPKLLGPALEDARLALHAPDRDLLELREGLEPLPDLVGETVEGAHDELADWELLEGVEVCHQVLLADEVGAVVGPGESFKVDTETEGFATGFPEVRPIHSYGTYHKISMRYRENRQPHKFHLLLGYVVHILRTRVSSKSWLLDGRSEAAANSRG